MWMKRVQSASIPLCPDGLLVGALLVGHFTAVGAGFALLIQEGAIGGAGSIERTVFFAPNFDCHTEDAEAQ